MTANDLNAAIDRLEDAATTETGPRFTFLIGSGMSNEFIPSTRKMVSFFNAEMGPRTRALMRDHESQADSVAYQEAATQLKQSRGERGLARAVRRAVLESHKTIVGLDNPQIENLDKVTNPENWDITREQLALARFISLLPSHRRGPIFTTNFDPQIELALAYFGVQCTTVAAENNNAFAIDGLIDTIPVVHLHGFWLQTATLSTIDQLQRDRPELEKQIQLQIGNSILVVLGYGGWEDSFTRALGDAFRTGKFGALATETLWVARAESSAKDSPFLASITGSAGLQKYYGTPASDLLEQSADAIAHLSTRNRDAWPGWEPVPRRIELSDPASEEVMRFVEGAQPNWRDAKILGQLTSTRTAINSIKGIALNGTGDAIIGLSGPTGEGKSLALRQIAIELCGELTESVLLFREPTAATISPDWMEGIRKRSGLTILFVDEADLVTRELGVSLNTGDLDTGRVIVVAALHAHYENRLKSLATSCSLRYEAIHFGELSYSDSIVVAQRWKELDLLPPKFDSQDVAQVASHLQEISTSVVNSSLFGGVLELWMSDALVSRIADLMVRLTQSRIYDVQFSEILYVIATIQEFWDRSGEGGRGITIGGLSAYVGNGNDELAALVLAPLGREVGLSLIGNRIYVRHPSMLSPILASADPARKEYIARKIGTVGGRMRMTKPSARSEYSEMYHFCTRLTGRPSEALAAAWGAVAGATELLEPRVTLIATLRRAGNTDHAKTFAARLGEDLSRFRDRSESERGYWVERSVIESKSGELYESIRFAARSLADLNGSILKHDQMTYGLVNIAQPAEKLIGRRDPRAIELLTRTLDLLCMLPNAARYFPSVRKHSSSGSKPIQRVNEFRKSLQPFMSIDYSGGAWTYQALTSEATRLSLSDRL